MFFFFPKDRKENDKRELSCGSTGPLGEVACGLFVFFFFFLSPTCGLFVWEYTIHKNTSYVLMISLLVHLPNGFFFLILYIRYDIYFSPHIEDIPLSLPRFTFSPSK